MRMVNMMNLKFLVLLLAFAFVGAVHGADEAPATPSKEQDYFAIVGGEVIPVSEYAVRLRLGARNKFYHGKVPDEEIKAFKKRIADDVIERVLLLQEAKKRGLKPDVENVETRLARIEGQRKDDPKWQEAREKLLPKMRTELEQDSLVELLEKNVRDVPEPKLKDVRKYYENNPDKFTVPEKIKVSLIMLKVDPSSPNDVWTAAVEEAGDIVKKLRAKADFAELARIHSADESAAKGGDMGYIHKGMLAIPAQNVVDMMSANEISEPVVLLQGVAIFRLDDRTTAKLNPFERIKDRAQALLKRDQSGEAWKNLISDLRKKTKIKLNEDLLKVRSDST